MSNYNDNAIPYGSRTATFKRPTGGGGSGTSSTYGTSLGSYVLENITATRTAYVGKRYNEVRAPNGSFGVEDFVEMSAVAQLATGSTKQLRIGDGFTDTFDTDLGAESFIVTSADQPEAQGDYKKQSIKLIKAYAVTI